MSSSSSSFSSSSSSTWQEEAFIKLKRRNDFFEPFEAIYRDYELVSKDNMSLVAKVLDLERYTVDFQCELREMASRPGADTSQVVQYVHQRIRGLQDLIRKRES